MRRAQPTLLADVAETRSSLVEILLIAVLLALGINLVSPVVSSRIGEKWSASIGFLLVLGAAAYLSYKKLRRRRMSRSIRAVFFTGRRKNLSVDDGSEAGPLKIIEVPQYEFGEEFLSLAKSLFKENPALERQWRRSFIGDFSSEGGGVAGLSGAAIVRELVEYILLESLSTHVTDFFNGHGFDGDRLVEMRRDDILQLLPGNRVLELFSRNYKDRPGFPADEDDEVGGYKVTGIFHEGLYFNEFDLTLPKGSEVRRTDDGAILIRNKSMSVTFKVDFENDLAVAPSGFVEHYMGCPDVFEVDSWQVRVSVKAVVKSRVVAYGMGLAYHQWLESFLESVVPRLDFDVFLDQMNWSTVAGMMHCFSRFSGSESKDV